MRACAKSFVCFWWSRKQFVIVFPDYVINISSLFHHQLITIVCVFLRCWIDSFTECAETWGLRVLSCSTLCKIKDGQDLKACIRWKFLEKKKNRSFALNLWLTVILRPGRRLDQSWEYIFPFIMIWSCGLWGAASPVCGRVQQVISKFYALSYTPNRKLC